MNSLGNGKNLAYLAGILDGEGSISILKAMEARRNWRPRYSLRLSVDNTSAILIDWLQKNFDGHIHKRKSRRDSRENVNVANHQKAFFWYCGGNKASDILSLCLPYLMVKKEVAKIALKFQRTFKGKRTAYRLLPEILSLREQYYVRVKSLNGRSGGHIEGKVTTTF